MPKFEFPQQTNHSYLVVPKFLSSYIQVRSSEPFVQEFPDTLERIEEDINPHLNERNTFVELDFASILTLQTDVVKELIDCRIPFHVTCSYDEDYEVAYWHNMTTRTYTSLAGWTGMQKVKDRTAFEPELNHIKQQLDYIQAQHKMLKYDIAALMEVRNIYGLEY